MCEAIPGDSHVLSGFWTFLSDDKEFLLTFAGAEHQTILGTIVGKRELGSWFNIWWMFRHKHSAKTESSQFFPKAGLRSRSVAGQDHFKALSHPPPVVAVSEHCGNFHCSEHYRACLEPSPGGACGLFCLQSTIVAWPVRESETQMGPQKCTVQLLGSLGTAWWPVLSHGQGYKIKEPQPLTS
jgi:hypothetical protein